MGVDFEEQDEPCVEVKEKAKSSLYIFEVLDVLHYFTGLAWILQITCMPSVMINVFLPCVK